ncbi:MAG: PSD1 and planctomycete cytochrome C domain-containing protein [Bryobacteraceae bacterium]
MYLTGSIFPSAGVTVARFGVSLAILVCGLRGQTPDPSAFFESKIRPILVTRCGSCHGDKVQLGGKQLTSKDGMHRSGVVMAGDADASPLVQAVRYTGKTKMPPSGKLPDGEIQLLEKWIAEGAFWPDTDAKAKTISAAAHWAFQPVKNPAAPVVKDTAWAHSEIDRFILAKLEEKGIKPAADANKYALLRRATLDLTGLLPTRAEIEAFVKDSSPEAFEKVVDRLLASPSFGDRWGRHWLDITYYADTTGYGRRIPLPEAWRYRDYVIDSFNDDKPYNQFVEEQLAGPKGEGGKKRRKDATGQEATGFLVLGPWSWGSYDRAQTLLDAADLQVDMVGRTFLGLTLGCARCHDHKFDPIPNKEYYGLIGMFLSTKTVTMNNFGDGGVNMVPLPISTETAKRYAEEMEQYDRRVAAAEVAEKGYAKEREEVQKRITELKAKPKSGENDAALKAAEEQLTALKAKSEYAGDKQILEFIKYKKPRLPFVYAAEDFDMPQDTRIALRGDAHQLGAFAPRGVLSAVNWGKPPSIDPNSSGRRELAEWIANEKNPLTARVYVNRLWHHLFGDGIVGSTENFGARGDAPTHPELLDHLASHLVANGWSTKKTIREIVLSRVYQLSSTGTPSSLELDPDNKLLARANRRRMEVETIRDTMLQASGNLDAGRGGPSLPLTEQNMHTIGPFFLEDDTIIEDPIKNRRTVYQPVMRSSQMAPIDILNLFDFKDPDQVVGTRIPTVVPTQTLYLLNAPFVKEEAALLAKRLLADKSMNDEARVSALMLDALNRPATPRDIAQAAEFIAKTKDGIATAKLPTTDATQDAWARYCHVVLVSSEFLYRR